MRAYDRECRIEKLHAEGHRWSALETRARGRGDFVTAARSRDGLGRVMAALLEVPPPTVRYWNQRMGIFQTWPQTRRGA